MPSGINFTSPLSLVMPSSGSNGVFIAIPNQYSNMFNHDLLQQSVVSTSNVSLRSFPPRIIIAKILPILTSSASPPHPLRSSPVSTPRSLPNNNSGSGLIITNVAILPQLNAFSQSVSVSSSLSKVQVVLSRSV